MKIIHTCLRYPPASGGAETYVHDIVKQTRHVPDTLKHDNTLQNVRDVRVLTSRLRTHGPINELSPNLLLDDPLYIQRLHYLRTPFISYPRLQALPYYIGHHQPDILHGYSFWYQPADITARYAKTHHIPFIFHPIYYENNLRQKPIWQLYKHTIGRATFAAADIVAVLSNYEKKLIQDAGFPVKHFELIPPSIDTSALTQPLPNPFVSKKISHPILLSVGRLSLNKGFADTIKILPKLIKTYPKLSYIIIGEDFGDQKRLTKIATNLGIMNNVHFWGKVDRHKLIAAYQHADIFLHSSYYEAFGIVVAEAMATKTPVIARHAGAIPDLIQHNKTGWLFNSPDQLVQSINFVLQNIHSTQTITQLAQTNVQRNYDITSITKKIVSLYNKLTN